MLIRLLNHLLRHKSIKKKNNSKDSSANSDHINYPLNSNHNLVIAYSFLDSSFLFFSVGKFSSRINFIFFLLVTKDGSKWTEFECGTFFTTNCYCEGTDYHVVYLLNYELVRTPDKPSIQKDARVNRDKLKLASKEFDEPKICAQRQ